MSLNICVIIPAYNAAETITDVIKGALKHVSHVIVADDGSTDNTLRRAADAGAETISIEPNQGKGHALKLLFRKASEKGYDAVISMDADRQHDPGDIPLFLQANNTHPHDIILGSRMDEKKKIPRARYNAMHVARFYVSLAANQFIADTQCGFRLYPLSLINNMILTTDRYVTETEILMKAGDMGAKIRIVKISAIYGSQTSHFRTVLDVDAITTYVMSYLLIKWIIEGVSSDRPNTYSTNHVRDLIGKHKFINGRFLTFSLLIIYPATIFFLMEYIFLSPLIKNNFASVRKLGCGFFKITLATNMLPILLVIATIERICNWLGFKVRFTDRFIKTFYLDLWGKNEETIAK